MTQSSIEIQLPRLWIFLLQVTYLLISLDQASLNDPKIVPHLTSWQIARHTQSWRPSISGAWYAAAKGNWGNFPITPWSSNFFPEEPWVEKHGRAHHLFVIRHLLNGYSLTEFVVTVFKSAKSPFLFLRSECCKDDGKTTITLFIYRKD